MRAKRPGANGNRGETTRGANGIRGETTRIQMNEWSSRSSIEKRETTQLDNLLIPVKINSSKIKKVETV